MISSTESAPSAQAAGFPGFAPDACLVNRYAPGSRLSLHQDRNERDYGAPIVSVSLGMPAMFLFGGDDRAACWWKGRVARPSRPVRGRWPPCCRPAAL